MVGRTAAIESRRARALRAGEILRRLREEYPDAKCALDFSTPLELLVATILSAQCTDERVNQVTRELFKKYRTAGDYAHADVYELEKMIKPTGFYRNKANALKSTGQILVDQFGGKVPDTMADLMKLSGVGRKTANVILGNAHHKNEGIVVDTHVKRLANRLQLSTESNPEKVELDLLPLIPQPRWTLFSHLLIFHGRRVCNARKPKCEKCILFDLCPSRVMPGT